MDQSPHSIQVRDMVMKIRIPDGEGPYPVLLLLHGWTGDENVMWIFASRLPKNYLMIAPRGLYKSPDGGFGWQENRKDEWPTVAEFTPAVDTLLELVDQKNGSQHELSQALVGIPGAQEAIQRADFSEVSLVGFSQGAALSYSFALTHPERVNLLAGLAGFMPEESEPLVEKKPLAGKHVFITHGTQDDTVPIEKARRSVELMQRAGSDVIYCEEQAGHKLSASCFRALEAFFAQYTAD